LILRQGNKACINSELFRDYSRGVFLPYLSNLRQRPELPDEEAVLLIDNCGPHMAQDDIDLPAQEGVRVVTFAPHMTNIFHILDLTLFGIFKRRGQSHLPFEIENRTADFNFKTSKGVRSTTIHTNIWAAFRAIGLSFDDIRTVQRVLFDGRTVRESRGFQELWMINSGLENLSARCRNTKFGRINKAESKSRLVVCSTLSQATSDTSAGKKPKSGTPARLAGSMAIIL
jgi:hypothetical protein